MLCARGDKRSGRRGSGPTRPLPERRPIDWLANARHKWRTGAVSTSSMCPAGTRRASQLRLNQLPSAPNRPGSPVPQVAPPDLPYLRDGPRHVARRMPHGAAAPAHLTISHRASGVAARPYTATAFVTLGTWGARPKRRARARPMPPAWPPGRSFRTLRWARLPRGPHRRPVQRTQLARLTPAQSRQDSCHGYPLAVAPPRY